MLPLSRLSSLGELMPGLLSVASDVVVLGIRSDSATSDPPWLNRDLAPLPSRVVFILLGAGQMLWLRRLHQMGILVHCRLRPSTVLDVLHVVVIVAPEMVRPP